jgi:hypothetical protein
MESFLRSGNAVLALILLALATLAVIADAAEPGVTSPDVAPVTPPYVEPVTVQSTSIILNGDFENTRFSPGCHFNLPNATLNSGLADITAFGDAHEIDFMNTGGDCGFTGVPQSGAAKLAINRQGAGGPTDAFSFNLSGPITAGNSYTVRFYAWAYIDCDPEIGAVEIGTSSSPTSFGTIVYSGLPTLTGWTLLGGTFTAAANATYLTVRVAANADCWNHIDNFSLIDGGPVAVSATSWGSVKSEYRK